MRTLRFCEFRCLLPCFSTRMICGKICFVSKRKGLYIPSACIFLRQRFFFFWEWPRIYAGRILNVFSRVDADLMNAQRCNIIWYKGVLYIDGHLIMNDKSPSICYVRERYTNNLGLDCQSVLARNATFQSCILFHASLWLLGAILLISWCFVHFFQWIGIFESCWYIA